MRNRFVTTAALLFLLVSLSACHRTSSPQADPEWLGSEVVEEIAEELECVDGLCNEDNNLGHFSNVVLEGYVDVRIKQGGKSRSITLLDPAMAKQNLLSVSGDTLFVAARGKKPVSVEIQLPTLHRLIFRGKGDLSASGLQGTAIDITTNGESHIHLTGRMHIQALNLKGSGPVFIDGIENGAMSLHIAGNHSVNLTGFIHLRTLEFSGAGLLSMYWINTPSLDIVGRGKGFVKLAGRVKTLGVQLHDQAELDAKYLRAEEGFIETFNQSQADVLVKQVLNSSAFDQSNIYYHKDPSFQTVHMFHSGSVLDLNGMR